MKYTQSLKKNIDFRTVYNKGKSIANKNLVIYILPNNILENFLGVSVSKKVGNSVRRSRITRLIKESYRDTEENIKRGYNIIIIARMPTASLTFFEIKNSLIHLLKKHNIYLK